MRRQKPFNFSLVRAPFHAAARNVMTPYHLTERRDRRLIVFLREVAIAPEYFYLLSQQILLLRHLRLNYAFNQHPIVDWLFFACCLLQLLLVGVHQSVHVHFERPLEKVNKFHLSEGQIVLLLGQRHDLKLGLETVSLYQHVHEGRVKVEGQALWFVDELVEALAFLPSPHRRQYHTI